MFAVMLVVAVALGAQPSKRPTDEARGEELYRRHCMACHGVANDGKGPVASDLVAVVPDLIGKVNTEDAMVRSVDKGRGAMPGYAATFERADAIRVLKYMMTLNLDNPLPDADAEAATADGSPKKGAEPKRPSKPVTP